MTPQELAHLGLSAPPFDKAIGDDGLWMSPSKAELVDELCGAIEARRWCVVTGEPGVGKTCVLRAVRHLVSPERFRLTYCHNTTLGRRDWRWCTNGFPRCPIRANRGGVSHRTVPMPKPSKVHPKHKTTYRVQNWQEYERALRSRGDLTVWISEDVRAAWVAPPSGKRGAQPIYDDVAIEACLTISMLFRLPLRQTEGFLRSLFLLAGIDLPIPDHTLVSRRRKSLHVERSQRQTNGPLCLVFDATGLKVFGQGDWATKKHGIRGSGWRKLHIGVQPDGHIVAAKLTDSDIRDHEPVPDLFGKINGPIARVIADGAYDQEAVYRAVRGRGASTVIPPRRRATKSSGDAMFAQRDAAIDRIEEVGRRQWRKEAGYHQQARAENSFFRYKAAFGSRLRARTPEGQQTEVLLGVRILNRHHDLGTPDSVEVLR